MNNAYLAKHAPIVRERMKRAGVRLAAILNTVFADSVVSASEVSVRPAIQDGAEEIRRLANQIERLEQAIRTLTYELRSRRLGGDGPD